MYVLQKNYIFYYKFFYDKRERLKLIMDSWKNYNT
jgi:hypothetical protein